MGSRIHVGVSGFSYPAWRGTFYPKGAKSEDLLASYAERLDSVEINSSFYGAPRLETVRNWAAKTREEFRFSFKAPRLITHVSKLGTGSAEAAIRFSTTVETLGPRLGAILFQLPPFFKRDPESLDAFLRETRSVQKRVFEFRDTSWFDESVYEVLRDHEAAFCIAETEDLAPTLEVTSDIAYFRLRKDSYLGEDVDSWAGRIQEVAKGAKETYVYLRHDESGDNAVLAQRLAKNVVA